MARKLQGLEEFAKLLRPLSKVKKRELDAKVEQHKKRAVKRKKKS